MIEAEDISGEIDQEAAAAATLMKELARCVCDLWSNTF